MITFLLNFILEKSFSPWFHACTLYMHEVYFKAWPFLSSFTCCDRTYIFFFNSSEGQHVLSIRPVNRHIKTQLIKFCWKSGVVLLQLFDYNNKHRAHSSLYKRDSLPAHIPLALIDADHLNGIIDTLGNFLVVFTVLCSFPCKSLHVLSFWSVLCSLTHESHLMRITRYYFMSLCKIKLNNNSGKHKWNSFTAASSNFCFLALSKDADSVAGRSSSSQDAWKLNLKSWDVSLLKLWKDRGPKLSHRLNDDVWVVAAARLERGQRSPLSRGSVFTKKPHWGAQGNSDDLLLPMSHAVCVREREGLVSEWPLTLCYCKSNVWVFVSRQFV